jgi:ABC-type transporter MlaC component
METPNMFKTLFTVLTFTLSLANVAFAEEAAAPTPASAPVEQAPAPKKFEGEAAKIQEKMETLFDASRKVNGPAATRDKYRQVIDSSLDWDRISTDCLGKNSTKGTAAQRQQFRTLLRDVVEKTAFSRLDTFWDGTTYQFTKIDVTGEKAHVSSMFNVKNKSFSLDYFLHKKSGGWSIYDISFKNERYSENIKEQIGEFLAQGNFNTLLDKLKKRREELDREASGAKSKKS